jgi:uncharacterized repeat protein (TIGR03803 family)
MKTNCIGLLAGVAGCALALQFPSIAAAHPKESVVHSFGNGTDGELLRAGLIDVKGTMYGTTYAGGANGYGAVFSLNPKSGAETVLYSFQNNGSDGQSPKAGLIDVQGTLYGTTLAGGSQGVGTVFSVDPATGAEKIVYSFQNSGSDGQSPVAGLIDVNGTLYGATEFGGAAGLGTLFAINLTTGAESVVHVFGGGSDGREPVAGLVNVSGTLYGTTLSGGASGGGTVFSFDPSTGTETAVYAFCSQQSCTDGENPYAGVIDVSGTLYGTTSVGGANCADFGGCGTVYALAPATGKETVLHSFGNGTDGTYPIGGVTVIKGDLYGTTPEGGAYCTSGGCGTVYSLKLKSGAEKVLHSFGNGTDGAIPDAGMINVKGTLYGTTYSGGAYGYGTVFALSKP